MRLLTSFLSGGLFGLGLLISGMTDTAKVQGWLDLGGAWDPTLAFVLGGAILPMVLAWRIAARRGRALFGDPIPALPEQRIDARLIGGSVLFGLGWAMAGFCPGPALAVVGWAGLPAVVFTLAMVGGMIAWPLLQRMAPAAARA